MRRLAVLVALLAACGDDSPVRHLDAGMTDSPGVDIDAPMAQPVTLTVTYAGTPQAGVRVYFQNPDSSLISNTMTDATGVASALMPNGGFVTAINAFAGIPAGLPSNEVYIYAGVKSGDHLSLANGSTYAPQGVTVNGAADTTAGVVSYELSSQCGDWTPNVAGDPPTFSFELFAPCPTSDFLVRSLDDAGDIVHWAYAPNTTVTATTDLTAAALTNAPTTKTYTLNNADAFEGQMVVRQALASTHGEIASFQTIAFDPDLNQLLAASLKLPAFANAIDIVDASGILDTDSEHHLIEWGPFAASYTTDVAARRLANITSPMIDTSSHQLTWTQDATGVAPEFVTAWGLASRSEPTSLNWQFWIAAPAGSPVQLPTLPTDVEDFNVGATDNYQIYDVNLGKITGGYDAVRAHLFDLAFAVRNESPPTTVITSATGSAALELWQPRGLLTRSAPKGPRAPSNQRVLTRAR